MLRGCIRADFSFDPYLCACARVHVVHVSCTKKEKKKRKKKEGSTLREDEAKSQGDTSHGSNSSAYRKVLLEKKNNVSHSPPSRLALRKKYSVAAK